MGKTTYKKCILAYAEQQAGPATNRLANRPNPAGQRARWSTGPEYVPRQEFSADHNVHDFVKGGVEKFHVPYIGVPVLIRKVMLQR
jgi:hypothetical protein